MTENDANNTAKWGVAPWIAVALGVLALLLGALALYFFIRDNDHPANDSADVGFVRDMSVHHAQAVQMANTAYRRTDDPDIARLARDIADTQQFQIGMMTGWLDIWGLPVSSGQPPMAWMGEHFMVLPTPPAGLEEDDSMAGMDMEDATIPAAGSDEEAPLMPGMATDSEVAALETLPVDEMNAQFLRLMIRHHQGGVVMAEAELELGDEEIVRNFAQQVVNSQSAEISTMTEMLSELPAGAGSTDTSTPAIGTPTAATPGATPVADHEEH